MPDPPPAGAARLGVAPERLGRWLDGVAERHGSFAEVVLRRTAPCASPARTRTTVALRAPFGWTPGAAAARHLHRGRAAAAPGGGAPGPARGAGPSGCSTGPASSSPRWTPGRSSHPAIPSEYDPVAAQPYFSYIIISVLNNNTTHMRSWRLNDQFQFEEEEINSQILQNIKI